MVDRGLSNSRPRRIGLVGCVKKKAAVPRRAREVYISPLFGGRRDYVQVTCTEWWILSALHGLVHPDEKITPYDATLKDASVAERQRWSGRVLGAIDALIQPVPGTWFEIHAGSEYRDYGLVAGLRARGCTVENPTAGLSFGKQLALYREHRRRQVPK